MGCLFRQLLFADKNAVRQCDTACPAHAHNADAACADGRGDCCNHIIKHVFSFHKKPPLLKNCRFCENNYIFLRRRQIKFGSNLFKGLQVFEGSALKVFFALQADFWRV